MRCRQSMGRYGLGEDTEELYPFELSGGMTRRVLISTAVMEHPRLVIADEPTPGLHISAARRVPVSYTHLDVYKRQPERRGGTYRRGSAEGGIN